MSAARMARDRNAAHPIALSGRTIASELEQIATLPRLYASTCGGTCMEPDLADGSILVFDKEAPLAGGDYVSIWLKPDSVFAGATNRMVKQLALSLKPGLTFPYAERGGNVRPAVIVMMNNPPRQFRIPVGDILAMHRCIGEAKATSRGLCDVTSRFGPDGRRQPLERVA